VNAPRRAFAERYRQERESAGAKLPHLILAAVLGQRSRLRAWLSPLSPPELSDSLETVLENGHRGHGVRTTSADVARYMASNTIVPFLLADLALSRADLAEMVAANRDPVALAQDWLASADNRQLDEFRRRLETLIVLDPACGTGPFLLAALHVLERLHTACLTRLGEPCSLAAVRRRIVSHTLHGIDLLPEAVELCRLRLRLELLDGDPMPADNLRAGNALAPLHSGLAVSRSADIILGNPPYLELRQVDYQPAGFRCQDTGAVHALFIERGLELLKPGGWMSMIVPMSLVSTQRMKCVQELLEAGRDVWYANFSWRPARLFPGVNRAMTLFVASASERPRTWTTGYLKWRSRERSQLLRRFTFIEAPRERPSFWVPKLSEERERPLLEKLLRVPTTVQDFLSPEDAPDRRIYYRTDGGLYWKVFTDFAPSFSCNGRAGHSTRETWLTVRDAAITAPLIAVLSSDLFWWWYTVTSNCRHLNPIDLNRFPLPASILNDPELSRLGRAYLCDIVRHSSPRVRRQKQTGRTETQTFRIHQSRPLILAIGKALAPHYGLTEEERDYLANYDLAFRMSGAGSRTID
jgi:methylase of polypeptide subunit release factors